LPKVWAVGGDGRHGRHRLPERLQSRFCKTVPTSRSSCSTPRSTPTPAARTLTPRPCRRSRHEHLRPQPARARTLRRRPSLKPSSPATARPSSRRFPMANAPKLYRAFSMDWNIVAPMFSRPSPPASPSTAWQRHGASSRPSASAIRAASRVRLQSPPRRKPIRKPRHQGQSLD